jgi:hypothetical protein
VILLPTSAIYGLQNALLNGPGSPTVSGSVVTPPTASGDGITPPGPGGGLPPSLHLYQPGDYYPASGQTLNQLASKFGTTPDDIYYNSHNAWIISFLTGAPPAGVGGFSKRATVGITGPVFLTPHSKPFAEGTAGYAI